MIAQSRINKSQLFSSYNRLKATAADKPRVNRALGVAQSNQPRPYITTADSCTCKDWEFRGSKTGVACKHMTALALVVPAVEVTPAPAPRRSLVEINSFLFD